MAQHKTIESVNPLSLTAMVVCSTFVGIVAGLGSVVFRLMIGLIHNLLFYGRLDIHYNANVFHPASPWGVGIIFIPALASIVVTWLIENFALEARGHGVPEVMDAIHNKQGVIRPLVAIVKSIASAISIGSGGSVGREGPIVQIGSAFGSTLGQWVSMPASQRVVLIAAGASAGIAATFNAPIGGLAFAIELIMVSVNASNIAIVLFSTVIAAYIGCVFLGLYPTFNIPSLAIAHGHLTDYWLLLLFIPFGIICGLAATMMIHSLYFVEDLFARLPVNNYFRHFIGMLILGIILYVFMHLFGHYYLGGVGYATIVDVLTHTISNPWFLLLLFVGKLLATSLTLGSGASGGIFSPSLFLGAVLGSAFAGLMHLIFPYLTISQPLFAIAGMAAIVSGVTGAVLTAIIMIFELTRDYNAVLPLILSVVFSHSTRNLLSKETIYTLKLLRRGVYISCGLQADLMSLQTASHVMSRQFQIISLHDLLTMNLPLKNKGYWIIEDQGIILGLLQPHRLMPQEQITQANYLQYIDSHFLIIKPNQQKNKILRALALYEYHTFFVFKEPGSRQAQEVMGVITSHEMIKASASQAQGMD